MIITIIIIVIINIIIINILLLIIIIAVVVIIIITIIIIFEISSLNLLPKFHPKTKNFKFGTKSTLFRYF